MAHLASPRNVLLLTSFAALLGAPGCDDVDAPLPEDLELDESLSELDGPEELEELEELEDLQELEDPELPEGATDFEDGGNAVFTPTSLGRKGNTIASADLDGDGTNELYTAFYSPVHGAAIYRGTKSNPAQFRVFGPSADLRVTHLAGGDVSGDGVDELYVGLEREQFGDFTGALHRMDASGAMTTVLGFSDLGVTALTVGDADGSPGQELYSAYVDSSGYGSIYQSQTGNTRGGWYDGAAGATFVALATAQFPGSSSEQLCLAYQTATQTGINVGTHPLYRSNGPIWTVTAMEAGDADGDGSDELYMALRHTSALSSVYRSDFGIGLNARLYGPSQYWDVASIQVGQFDTDVTEEIVTGFNHVSGISSMYLSESGALPGLRVYGPSSVWEL